jgi:outer membrane receptor protein involved in Fe transport
MVGNDTGPYRLKPYANFSGIYNSYTYAALPTLYPNDQLQPEKTYSYETGADLRFLNGRINLDFTYYYKQSQNQIVEAQTPAASGYERRIYNAGAIENQGWELLLTGNPVQTRDFEWSIMANFSKNNSKVLKMLDEASRITLNQWHKSFVYVEEGMPYGILRARIWKRDEQGHRLVDKNGVPLIEDDQYLGSANPDFLAGLSNRFRYKNIDLYLLLDFKKGGGIFSASWKKAITAGVFKESLDGREDYYFRNVIMGDGHTPPYVWGGKFYDAYFEDGSPTNYYYMPQGYGGLVDEIDELTYYDASFIKLREISVGYTFPKSILAKTPFSNLRFSLVGRNLWIIHQNTPKGLDPEATVTSGNGQGIEFGSLPPTTTLGFDIKISF